MPSEPLSLTAYAATRKARGLVGGSHVAVLKAIETGRLLNCLVKVDGKNKIGDPDLADQEWTANTDYTKATSVVRDLALPPTPVVPATPGDESAHEGMSTADATRIEKIWKAKTAELDFKVEAGELVEAKGVAKKMGEVFSECRTKILGVPSRLRQQDPTLSAAQLALVESVLRETLEALAGSDT